MSTDKDRGIYEFTVQPIRQHLAQPFKYRAELTPDYKSYVGGEKACTATYCVGEGDTVLAAIRTLCEKLEGEEEKTDASN